MPAGDSALGLHTEQAGIQEILTLFPPDTHRTKDPEDVGRGPDSVMGLALTDRAYAAGKTGVEGVHR